MSMCDGVNRQNFSGLENQARENLEISEDKSLDAPSAVITGIGPIDFVLRVYNSIRTKFEEYNF